MAGKLNQAARQTIIIDSNEKVSEGYFRLGAECNSHYLQAKAGQFVTIRLPEEKEPLLRRPFSIHRIIKQKSGKPRIEILYRVVGGFTKKLSQANPQCRLDLLGPLGKGFSVKKYNKSIAIVAGGIGVAPLVFLAGQLKNAGTDMGQVTVFIGGRLKNDILCESIFEKMGAQIQIATEDGSLGFHGMITPPFENWLQKNNNAEMIYACGPHAMLRAIGKMAAKAKIPCEVSIETLMACGLGVCMGCAVKTRDKTEGYRHVCKDGPVFDAAALE
jgi:dihydroorotate dehydrogenase electron transfer subunit